MRLEVLTLAFSVIGLVPLAWGIQEWRGLERKEQFFKRAEQASRPSNAQIHLKTDRRTFNHVHDFAIEDGIIWCRRHNHVHEEWKPDYFDGWAYGESPQRISSDGANLIAVDQNNYVHYKKVLTEFRNSEINEANRHKLAHGEVDLDQDAYIAVDKSKRDNWYDKWCSLPYMNAHFFVNLLTGKRLKLPEFIKAFSISHRGLYNHYLSDAQGRTHLTDGGTTTLYGLDQNGRVIHLYDPWSPQLAKITIPLPESSERLFEADGIQSSASTLMVYGYEQERGRDARTLQILTQMVDIDTAGWNPFFEYAYFSEPEKPSQWAVPFPSWQAHPLELEENSCVTKTMTIIQTGEGNEARELRVEGVKQGQAGIYFKKIDEPHWRFIGTEQAADLVMQQALPLVKPIEKPFNCSVRNYRSQQLQFSHLSAHAAALLQHFSPHALQGQLELTIDGQTYPLT